MGEKTQPADRLLGNDKPLLLRSNGQMINTNSSELPFKMMLWVFNGMLRTDGVIRVFSVNASRGRGFSIWFLPNGMFEWRLVCSSFGFKLRFGGVKTWFSSWVEGVEGELGKFSVEDFHLSWSWRVASDHPITSSYSMHCDWHAFMSESQYAIMHPLDVNNTLAWCLTRSQEITWN